MKSNMKYNPRTPNFGDWIALIIVAVVMTGIVVKCIEKIIELLP